MTTNPAQAALEVRDLSIGTATRRLVDGVSFRVEHGRTLGLVGESGSGKSLTCMSVPALLPRGVRRLSGTVTIGDTDVTSLSGRALERVRGTDIGVIFQEPMSSLNPAFTIGDQLAGRLRRHHGLSRSDAEKRTVETLASVGIPRPDLRARSYPFQLSGGMSQRAMIAMAIIGRPRVLLADEPTTALDVTVQAQVLELLKQLQAELDMAVVFVSHDLGVIKEVADDIAVMYAGQVVDSGPADQVLTRPGHPYTEGLLQASQPRGVDGGGLYVIPGAPPADPGAVIGCRFADRCPYATDVCRVEPGLRAVGPAGHSRCARVDDLRLQGVVSHG